jgi:hypothetical protein
MPLTGRSTTQDRNPLIRKRFDERRRSALRDAVTPETIEEFRSDVIGRRPRTLALRHLLNFMRMSPIEGRTFAYAAPSYETYYLARLHAERGMPPTVDTSHTFPTKEEAIVAAFLERAHEIIGTPYPEAEMS